MPAPVASGWSDRRVGLAPTGKRRLVTAHVEISPSSVRRIWKGHGLQPHRVRAFKLSNDPKFAEKLKEVVGLYIDPPAHAVVLSLDEKSQIQALSPLTDRIRTKLPLADLASAAKSLEDRR